MTNAAHTRTPYAVALHTIRTRGVARPGHPVAMMAPRAEIVAAGCTVDALERMTHGDDPAFVQLPDGMIAQRAWCWHDYAQIREGADLRVHVTRGDRVIAVVDTLEQAIEAADAAERRDPARYRPAIVDASAHGRDGRNAMGEAR